MTKRGFPSVLAVVKKAPIPLTKGAVLAVAKENGVEDPQKNLSLLESSGMIVETEKEGKTVLVLTHKALGQ